VHLSLPVRVVAYLLLLQIAFPPGSKLTRADLSPRSKMLSESQIVQTQDPRKSCSEVYPIPQGSELWKSCQDVGRSACGGPDQCLCGQNERLVTFKCDEGTLNKCVQDSACKANANNSEY
jgi:hypothetical protein